MKLWESHKENSLFVNNKVFLNSFAISLSLCSSVSIKNSWDFSPSIFSRRWRRKVFAMNFVEEEGDDDAGCECERERNRVVVQTLYFYLSKWLGCERCKKSNWYHGKARSEKTFSCFFFLFPRMLCFSHASIYVSLMIMLTFLCAFECSEEVEKFV